MESLELKRKLEKKKLTERSSKHALWLSCEYHLPNVSVHAALI